VPDLNSDRVVDLLDLVLVALHFGDEVPVGDVTVYVTKTGSKYHKADCWNLNRCAIPVRKGLAEICGYTPCGGCNP